MAEILPHYYRAAERVWEGVSVRQAGIVTEVLKGIAANTQDAIARLERENP